MADAPSTTGDFQAQIDELERELAQARDEQRASADLLRVIGGAESNLAEVLRTVLGVAARLCEADVGLIWQNLEETYRLAASFGLSDAENDWVATLVFRRDEINGPSRVAEGRASIRRDWGSSGALRFNAAQHPSDRELLSRLGVQAWLGVPLIDASFTGMFSLMRRDKRTFTEREMQLVESFAAQAVIAIENARLFNELQERNRDVSEALERQTAIAEVLELIGRTPGDVSGVIETIMHRAVALSGASDATVIVREGAGFRIAASTLQFDMTDPIVAIDLSDPRSKRARALRTGETEYVEDLLELELPSVATSVALDLGIRAIVHVPLRSASESVGLLQVFGAEPRCFTHAHIALLEAFADQAVIAIENARLFNELEERNREVREALDQQTAVAEVLQIISRSAFDLDAILQTLAETASRMMDGEAALIARVVDGMLVLAAGANTNRDELDWMMALPPQPLDFQGTGQIAMRNRRPLFVPASLYRERRPTMPPMFQEYFDRFGETLTTLDIPLLSGSEALGGIQIMSHSERGFADREIRMLETFADQAVIAIENARLFNEIQEKSAELEIASRHKSEFLASMSHELRTPLNAIIGYSELLAEECEEVGDEGYLPDLARINTAAKHQLTLINDILDLSKIEAGRMTIFAEDFDIPTLLDGVKSMVSPLVEKNGNTLVLECPPDAGAMHADATKVRQALFNLLSNAAKFTEQGTITLTVRATSDSVSFDVTDTGIGMSEEAIGRPFEAFSQAEASTSSKYGGTGLGLALSREFCRLMGGDITVASAPGEGSTFTITLPRTVQGE
jgi:signal transduction histidine kinase